MMSELQKELFEKTCDFYHITDPVSISLLSQFHILYQYWDDKKGMDQPLYEQKERELMEKVIEADPDRFHMIVFSDTSSDRIREAIKTSAKESNSDVHWIGHERRVQKHTVGDGDMLHYEYWRKSVPVLFIRKEGKKDE